MLSPTAAAIVPGSTSPPPSQREQSPKADPLKPASLPQPPAIPTLLTSAAGESDITALEARCTHLSQELMRRSTAVHQQAVRLSEQEAELSTLKKLLSKQEQQLKALRKAVTSAEKWQERSWLKRAFHKWRAPGAR